MFTRDLYPHQHPNPRPLPATFRHTPATFGLAVYCSDFGHVSHVMCFSSFSIESSVLAILASTVFWSVNFLFSPRLRSSFFWGTLWLSCFCGPFLFCWLVYRGRGCDGGGLFSVSVFSFCMSWPSSTWSFIRSLSVSRRSSGVLGGEMSVSSLSPKLGSRYCAIESSRWDMLQQFWGAITVPAVSTLCESLQLLFEKGVANYLRER